MLATLYFNIICGSAPRTHSAHTLLSGSYISLASSFYTRAQAHAPNYSLEYLHDLANCTTNSLDANNLDAN